MALNQVADFLQATGTFFMATVDGDKPRLRPLGLSFTFEDKLYFGIGDFKDVYKQLQVNPNVEIVACKQDGHWLRYSGKAVFETDPRYEEAALDIMPDLKNVYNETTGNHMAVFSLDEATALEIPMMGEGENLLA